MAITGITALSPVMPRQFQDLVRNVIEYEAVWDPDSVGSNGEQHEDVAIPGARLGDHVWVTIDIDVQNLDVVGHVTASDVVTLGLHNPSAGAVNLGSCNVHVVVLQFRHKHSD